MPNHPQKTRLDQALVERGFARSRAQARDAIKRGIVLVQGEVCEKPARSIFNSTQINLTENPSAYVSRGGLKLAHALEEFGVSVMGKTVMDIGASTGGFTDVLLQNGAEKVFAIDVGSEQLHPSLRQDRRVVCLENLNIRNVSSEHVPQKCDLLVSDVSFISLTKALPSALKCTKDQAELIALIKPQFEVGPDLVGKGGIVRDQTLREKVVRDISSWVDLQECWHSRKICPSPIEGPDGNMEYLLFARKN